MDADFSAAPPETALYTADADEAIRPAARSNAESDRAIPEEAESGTARVFPELGPNDSLEFPVGVGASENNWPKLGTDAVLRICA